MQNENMLLFENRLEVNKKFMLEYARFKRWHSPLPYLGIAFFAYMIGAFLYFLIAWQLFDYWYLVIAAGFLALYFIIDMVNLRRDMKMLEEQSGGRPYFLIKRFYEDGIEYGDSSADAFKSNDYSIVRKMRETKGLIIVSTEAKRDYVLKKEGFTVGNAEDFKAFINRKLMNGKK